GPVKSWKCAEISRTAEEGQPPFPFTARGMILGTKTPHGHPLQLQQERLTHLRQGERGSLAAWRRIREPRRRTGAGGPRGARRLTPGRRATRGPSRSVS